MRVSELGFKIIDKLSKRTCASAQCRASSIELCRSGIASGRRSDAITAKAQENRLSALTR